VSVLGLFFVLVLMIALVLAGSGSKARRDRDLSRRMSAPSATPIVPGRPDHGPGAWIPDPLAAAGGAVAEVAGFKEGLERKLERAGVAMSPGEFVAVNVGAVIVAIIVGAILHSFLLVAVLAVLVGAVPSLVLGRMLNKRLNALNAQLPDVLMILASSMRAGHSFLQALDTVSKEVGDPSGPEFSRVVTEIRLGRTPDDALNALAERVGTEEFRWAMMAVNVQREVGGNLAEVLDTLAQTVRERETVRRQVRVLSAEGRLSMWLLAAIPPAICLYIVWVNPEYMSLLWTTRLGWVMIVMAATLMTVGCFVARKIVRIDV
jgi:tight adherence protein B